MDDNGVSFHVGEKFSSLQELDLRLKSFQEKTYVQLYKRSSRKLVVGKAIGGKTVSEDVANRLIYKEIDYSCIHGGRNFVSQSSGQRPNTRFLYLFHKS